MAISLGLMISLGFTTLLCLLLFFYIRQRTSGIESKVTTLFKVVQDEVSKKNELCLRPQQMTVTEVQNDERVRVQNSDFNNNDYETDTDTDSDVSSLTCESHDEESGNEDLISVSTDGEESVNDEHRKDELESKPIKISHSTDDNEGNLETISDLNLFSTIMKNERSDNTDLNLDIVNDSEDHDSDIDENEEDEELDSILSEIESLGLIEDEDTEVNDDTNKAITEEKQPIEKDTINNDIGDIINYKKLSVSQLRGIVSDKGLHDNPKKLKKTELVELLQA
jgi:hypothetical protein